MSKHVIMILTSLTCIQGCAIVSTASTAVSIAVTAVEAGVDIITVVADSVVPDSDD